MKTRPILIVLLFMAMAFWIGTLLSENEIWGMEIIFNPYPPHTTTVHGFACDKEIQKCLKMGGVIRNKQIVDNPYIRPEHRAIMEEMIVEPYCDARGTLYEREFLKKPRWLDCDHPMPMQKKEVKR